VRCTLFPYTTLFRSSLRASYGEGFRPPSLFDLYGLTAIGIGASTLVYEPSPGLEPERVRAFELGADMAFEGGGRASVTLYRQRLDRKSTRLNSSHVK